MNSAMKHISTSKVGKETDIFQAARNIEQKTKVFKNSGRGNDSNIPESLDPSIEAAFSKRQQKNRMNLFFQLTNLEREIPMSEVVVKGAPKINHGRFHRQYRGSIYRGVSRNGNSW
jgi:hypothetical protein